MIRVTFKSCGSHVTVESPKCTCPSSSGVHEVVTSRPDAVTKRSVCVHFPPLCSPAPAGEKTGPSASTSWAPTSCSPMPHLWPEMQPAWPRTSRGALCPASCRTRRTARSSVAARHPPSLRPPAPPARPRCPHGTLPKVRNCCGSCRRTKGVVWFLRWEVYSCFAPC